MTSTTHARAAFRVRHPSTRKAVIALSSALFLTACTSTGAPIVTRFPGGGSSAMTASAPAESSLADQAEALLARGDYPAASKTFMAAAAAVPSASAQANDYRLRAASAALAAHDPVRADLLLDQIAAPAGNQAGDARQQARYRLLRAQTALARNDPQRALRLLPGSEPGSEPRIAEQMLLVRGQALARSNDPVAAVAALVNREHYLSGIVTLNQNRDLLWNLLQGATLDTTTMNRALAATPITRGWVELAHLARQQASPGELDGWRKRYPRHPGEERLAALFMQPAAVESSGAAMEVPAPLPLPPTPISTPPAAQTALPAPMAGTGSVALLLPQSGALASVADALRAGYEQAAHAAGEPAPRLYDTDGYAQAVADGAAVIVGPLLKEALTTVAAAPTVPIPVLGLNYLDAQHSAPAGLFQFGLAPEDEARAAAEDAHARGLTRALTMVPATDWGNRVQTAFASRLQELGGRVVDTGRYSGEPQGWADPVRRLLRYVAINDKKVAAEARAKAGPGVDPQRRNDFDFVFLAGRASQARVLWPLFRYYHADRTAVYATAAVNETSGDGDLAGIRFCDAPWLIDTRSAQPSLRDEALRGRSREAARFYAFGADAYLLASRMARNALHGGDPIPGATGMLAVEAGGAVRRKLVCARMSSGGDPSLLPPPDIGSVPIEP